MFPLPFIFQLITPIIVSTVLDKLSQFGKDTDWTKLKIETDGQVRKVVPGQMLDDTCVRFVNRQIDNIREALRDGREQERILKMLLNGQWIEAGQEIARHSFPDVKSSTAA